MPKVRRLLAAMTVATGSVLGGLTAYAAPIDSLGTVPEAGGAPSAVIPVHGMMGYECFWSKGCKYCRSCVQCGWVLQYCKKKHHG
jgi:hypothetical protein